jgi:hypothetical protein
VQFGAAVRERLLPALAETVKIVGNAAVDRLPDHLEGSVPDSLHAFQPAVARPGGNLGRIQVRNDPGRLPEGLDLERGGQFAFQPESDLIEGSNGIHQSILHPPCTHCGPRTPPILDIPKVCPTLL